MQAYVDSASLSQTAYCIAQASEDLTALGMPQHELCTILHIDFVQMHFKGACNINRQSRQDPANLTQMSEILPIMVASSFLLLQLHIAAQAANARV